MSTENITPPQNPRRAKYKGVKPSEGARRPMGSFWDAEQIFPRSPNGNRIVIYAKWSSHKTNIALAVCVDAIVEQGARVLFAAGEGAHAFLTERIPALCQARGITVESLDDKLVVAEKCPSLIDGAEVEAFVQEHMDFRPDIVVIDTLSEALTGEDEDRAGPASTAMGHADAIAKTFKASVLLVHHEGKKAGNGARGSSVFLSGADAAWQVVYDRPSGNVWRTVEKLKMGKAGRRVCSGVQVITLASYPPGGAPREVMTVTKLEPEKQAQAQQRVRALDAEALKVQSLQGHILAAMRRARDAAQQAKGECHYLTVEEIVSYMRLHKAGEPAADIERKEHNMGQKIRAAVRGARGKPGPLSPMVELDAQGDPIKPLRFTTQALDDADDM